MRVAVIIPAHNEQTTVSRVIESFHQQLPDAQIWVVDNHSTDETADVAQAALDRCGCDGGVLREWRRGKGFAVRRAFYEVEADIYVMVDADLTYPAAAVHQLMQPVVNGRADMVVGDRFPLGQYGTATPRRFHRTGNILVRVLIQRLFGSRIRDIMSGYRVMSRQLVKLFPILSSGFQLETELTIHAIDKEYIVQEIPIEYLPREEGSRSKVSTYRDGIRILKLVFFLFKTYRPMPFFLVIAGFFFLASVLVAYPVVHEFILTGLVLRIPSAILSVGLMVCSGISVAIALIMDSLAQYHRFAYEQKVMDYMSLERRPTPALAVAPARRGVSAIGTEQEA